MILFAMIAVAPAAIASYGMFNLQQYQWFLKIQESFWCNRPLRLVCLSNQDNDNV